MEDSVKGYQLLGFIELNGPELYDILDKPFGRSMLSA
jgi:hypothetical protein